MTKSILTSALLTTLLIFSTFSGYYLSDYSDEISTVNLDQMSTDSYSSTGNNSTNNNSATSDAHCLILTNATMNQSNYVNVYLINTCGTSIQYPGINASADNSGVTGLYDNWWYVVGPNSSYQMGWQLSLNQSIQNGTIITLSFQATVLNCGPNNSWQHSCPNSNNSSLSYQFTVLNSAGNNTTPIGPTEIMVSTSQIGGTWVGIVSLYNLTTNSTYDLNWELDSNGALVDFGMYLINSTVNSQLINFYYNASLSTQYCLNVSLWENGTLISTNYNCFTITVQQSTLLTATIVGTYSNAPWNVPITVSGMNNNSNYFVNWSLSSSVNPNSNSGMFQVNNTLNSSSGGYNFLLGILTPGTYCLNLDLYEVSAGFGLIADTYYNCFSVNQQLLPYVYSFTNSSSCYVTSCVLNQVADNLTYNNSYTMYWNLYTFTSNGGTAVNSTGSYTWTASSNIYHAPQMLWTNFTSGSGAIYCMSLDLYEYNNLVATSNDCFSPSTLAPYVYSVTNGNSCYTNSCLIDRIADNLTFGNSYIMHWNLYGSGVNNSGNYSWGATSSTYYAPQMHLSNLTPGSNYCMYLDLLDGITNSMIASSHDCFTPLTYIAPIPYVYSVVNSSACYTTTCTITNIATNLTLGNSYTMYWNLTYSNLSSTGAANTISFNATQSSFVSQISVSNLISNTTYCIHLELYDASNQVASTYWNFNHTCFVPQTLIVVTPSVNAYIHNTSLGNLGEIYLNNLENNTYSVSWSLGVLTNGTSLTTMVSGYWTLSGTQSSWYGYNVSNIPSLNFTNITSSPGTYCFTVTLYDFGTGMVYYGSDCITVGGPTGAMPHLDLIVNNMNNTHPVSGGSYLAEFTTLDELPNYNYSIYWELFDNVTGNMMDYGVINWHSNTSTNSSYFSTILPYLPNSSYCLEATYESLGYILDIDLYCFTVTSAYLPSPGMNVVSWYDANNVGYAGLYASNLTHDTFYEFNWTMFGLQQGILDTGVFQWHQNNNGTFLGSFAKNYNWPHLTPDTYCLDSSLWENGTYADADSSCFTISSSSTYMGGNETLNINVGTWSNYTHSGADISIVSVALVSGQNYSMSWNNYGENESGVVTWSALSPTSSEYIQYLLSPGNHCLDVVLKLVPSDGSANIALDSYYICYDVPVLQQQHPLAQVSVSWSSDEYDTVSNSTVNGTIIYTDLMIDSSYKLEWKLESYFWTIDELTVYWNASNDTQQAQVGWNGLTGGEYCLIVNLYLVDTSNPESLLLQDSANSCFTISSIDNNTDINYYDHCTDEENHYECWMNEWDLDGDGDFEQSNGYNYTECEQQSNGTWFCQIDDGNGQEPDELICHYNYNVGTNSNSALSQEIDEWIPYNLSTIMIMSGLDTDSLQYNFYVHCNMDLNRNIYVDNVLTSTLSDGFGSGFDGTYYYSYFILNTPSDYPAGVYEFVIQVESEPLGIENVHSTSVIVLAQTVVEDTAPQCSVYYGTDIGTIETQGTRIDASESGEHSAILSPGLYVVGIYCFDNDGDDIEVTLETSVGNVVENGSTIWAIGSISVPDVAGQVSMDYAWSSGTFSDSGTITVVSTVTDQGGSGGTFEIVEDTGDDGNAIPSVGFISTLIVSLIGAAFVSLRDSSSRRQDL